MYQWQIRWKTQRDAENRIRKSNRKKFQKEKNIKNWGKGNRKPYLKIFQYVYDIDLHIEGIPRDLHRTNKNIKWLNFLMFWTFQYLALILKYCYWCSCTWYFLFPFLIVHCYYIEIWFYILQPWETHSVLQFRRLLRICYIHDPVSVDKDNFTSPFAICMPLVSFLPYYTG